MGRVDERELLVRELRERAEGVSGGSMSLESVRSSARRIQRRRTAVTGAVAAAVAGITLPTGLAVTGALDEGPGRLDDRNYAASPAPKAEPQGPVALELDGLPRGDDAAVDRLVGDELVLSDGTVVKLPKEYQEIVSTGDGWVALASQEGNFTRDFLDADGTVTSSLPSSWGLATDLDGSRVSFVQVENGQWAVFDVLTDGMDPRSPFNEGNREVHPVGYAGDGVLIYEVGGEDSQVRVFEPSAEDYELPSTPRLIGAGGASEATGLVSGQTESRIDGSCWAVVRYDTGERQFETCENSLGQFNAAGSHVIGTDAYGDGPGPRSLAILDAQTGDVVVSFEQPRKGQLYLGDPVWEDDEHVLATVTDGLETQVVRFGLDGSLEVASETVTAEDYFLPSPIRFATQP